MKEGDKVTVTNPSNEDYGRTGIIVEIEGNLFWLSMNGKSVEYTGLIEAFDRNEIKIAE